MRSDEFREALAALKMRPFFVVSVVATLAVTLGILLCMVNLNHVLLVKALPYPEQQRLIVGVGSVYENNELRYPDVVSYPIAETLEKQADVAALAVLNFSEEIVTNVPQRPKLRITNATPRYFDMLGTRFAKGRGFGPQNGVGSREPVAILSYEAWQRHFAGGEDVLGDKVTINDVSYRIVGVTARDFAEPQMFQAGATTQIWLPWEFNSWQEDMHRNWAGLTDQLKVLALLKPGQTLADAEQMLNALIAGRFRQETQGSAFLKDGEYRIQAQTLKSYLVEDSRVAALLFLASSIALVIIACINVVNLLLSRAAEQQRQLAIRATLGAHLGHIFLRVLAEHLLLIGAAMAIALALAGGVTRAMRERLQEQLPRIAELALSPVTVLLAVALVLGLALAFSGIVARTIDYRRLAGSLNSSGKGSGLQISARVRRLLVVSQIALAAFLLVAITSVLQVSYETITRAPLFRVDDVVFANLNTGSLDLNEPTRIRYIDEIEARLQQLPQVNAVSNALFVPMMSNRWTTQLSLDPGGTDSYSVATNVIDDQYLAVMGEQIVGGNNFSAQDVNSSAKKMLINETLAGKIAPSGSALGKQVYWVGESQTPVLYEVSAVVRDVAVPRTPTLPRLYVTRFDGLRFIVELKPGQTLARDEFLEVISSVNKAFNLYEYETVRDMYDRLTLKDRFIVGVAIGLGLLTVALAGIGIYGVLSYGVQLRRYELGVRMSIGAGPQQIAALVYGENLRLLLVGALAGLAILMACYLLLLQLADYRLPLTAATGAAGYLVIILSVALACYLSLRAIITRWPVFALRT